MKTHQFIRRILDLGGVEIDVRGGTDHRRFLLPNGGVIDVPQGGKHGTHVRKYLVWKLRTLMRRTA